MCNLLLLLVKRCSFGPRDLDRRRREEQGLSLCRFEYHLHPQPQHAFIKPIFYANRGNKDNRCLLTWESFFRSSLEVKLYSVQ